MQRFVDIRTLSFTFGVIFLVLCLCMSYVSLTRKTYRGFNGWTAASLLNFLGLVLLSGRGLLPEALSVVIPNACIAAFTLLVTRGLLFYLGRTPQAGLAVLPALYLAGIVVLTYPFPSVSGRILLNSLLALVFFGFNTACLLRFAPAGLTSSCRFLAAVLGLQLPWWLFRFAYTAVAEMDISDFMTASRVQGWTFLLGSAGTVALFLGLIILNAQRIESEWRQAQEEVRTLRGIIPICASCKKIRDARGIWNQLEAYIRNHSDAEFSHGLCPECTRQLYGDTGQRG